MLYCASLLGILTYDLRANIKNGAFFFMARNEKSCDRKFAKSERNEGRYFLYFTVIHFDLQVAILDKLDLTRTINTDEYTVLQL